MENVKLVSETDEITQADIKSFEYEMHIKAHLISTSAETLQKMVQEEGAYTYFIQMLYCIVCNEPALILLDSNYLDKIYKIMEVHRFDEIGKKNYADINDLIGSINNIKAKSQEEKVEMIRDYILDQCEKRKIVVVTQDDYLNFLNSMIYDSITTHALESKDFSNVKDGNLFISSVNYILEEMPQLLIDENALDVTSEYLDAINKNSSLLEKVVNRGRKKIIKDTKEKIKILKEEE